MHTRDAEGNAATEKSKDEREGAPWRKKKQKKKKKKKKKPFFTGPLLSRGRTYVRIILVIRVIRIIPVIPV